MIIKSMIIKTKLQTKLIREQKFFLSSEDSVRETYFEDNPFRLLTKQEERDMELLDRQILETVNKLKPYVFFFAGTFLFFLIVSAISPQIASAASANFNKKEKKFFTTADIIDLRIKDEAIEKLNSAIKKKLPPGCIDFRTAASKKASNIKNGLGAVKKKVFRQLGGKNLDALEAENLNILLKDLYHVYFLLTPPKESSIFHLPHINLNFPKK
jgi:hypothetical protein